VSRVLNGIPVRGDLADRVLASIGELSYSPNRTVRSVRRRTSDVLALVIPDVENPFFTSLARGVEDLARSAGYSVVPCNTDDLPEQERTYLRIARDENMAWVIIAPVDSSVHLEWFLGVGRGVVALDRGVDAPVDQIKFDNVALGRVATEVLLSRGLSRIACITGPEHIETALDRAHGWRSAMENAGLPAPDSLLKYATFRVDGGQQATIELRACQFSTRVFSGWSV
jgi:LacI family transcriptional regulator